MTISPIAALVRKHDPDRFLAALFATPARRETLMLLYAFNHELARAREVSSQPILALIRLQWWREVVQGARRRHEVAEPLALALDAGVLQAPALLSMIEAREIEAEGEVPDMASWLAYVSGTAGTLAGEAGRVLGADDLQAARLQALGAAYGVAGQIRNIGSLAQQQRCLLPVDVLGAQGVTVDQMLRDPAAAAPVLPVLAEEGRILLRAGQGRFPRAIVAAGLTAVLARRDFSRLGTPAGRRGFGDRLAVTLAGLSGRI